MATTRLAQGTILFLAMIIIITRHWLGTAGYLFLMTLWIWTIWVPLRDMDGEERLNLLSGKTMSFAEGHHTKPGPCGAGSFT